MSAAMRRRRALTLLGLTLVLPGSAQLTAGNRRLGRAGLRVWLVVVLAAAGIGVLAALSRTMVIGLFTNSFFLLLLVVALVAGALFWAVLFIDSWRLTRPRGLPQPTRRLVGLVTAVLMLLTSGSMLWAARQVYVGRDVLGSIFGGNDAVGAAAGRYNVLLLGGDSGKGREGTRPDSINVVSIDADTGRSVMFGFARDTENINFRAGSLMRKLMPQGWNCGDECLLNGLYTWAEANKAKFPADVANPGVEATREAVEALSGLDIQYYVLVDLQGFQKLVDAVGGLTIDVKKRTPVGGGTSPIKYYIEPGVQKLSGYNALWYARSREGSNNYERMARQRCVMDAMLRQLDPATVVLKFQGLATASSSVLQTDLPGSELGRFGDLALKAKSQPVKSVNFVPPLMNPWRYDPTVITSTVAKTITASDTAKSGTARPSAAASKSTSKSTSGNAAGSKTGTGSTTTGSAKDAPSSELSAVCSAG